MRLTIIKTLFHFFNYMTTLQFHVKGIDPQLFRDSFDDAVRRKKKQWDKEKNTRPSCAAIVRVKNGSNYLYLSLCSIAELCNEMVIIDNNSTDNTLEIVKKFASRARESNKNLKIHVYHYPVNICKAGEGYGKCVQENPKRSIARYYKYAFGLSDCDYLMKWDSHCILLPRYISVINQKLKKRPLRIRLNIRDIYGRHHGMEYRIFKNDNKFWFEDREHFEVIRFSQNIPWYRFFDCIILRPSILHVKRLAYSGQ